MKTEQYIVLQDMYFPGARGVVDVIRRGECWPGTPVSMGYASREEVREEDRMVVLGEPEAVVCVPEDWLMPLSASMDPDPWLILHPDALPEGKIRLVKVHQALSDREEVDVPLENIRDGIFGMRGCTPEALRQDAYHTVVIRDREEWILC